MLDYDVGLSACRRDQLNRATTVTICAGTFRRGTYGAVRTLAVANFRSRDERFLAVYFGSLDDFWLLFHVLVFRGVPGLDTITPHLERPFHRLPHSRSMQSLIGCPRSPHICGGPGVSHPSPWIRPCTIEKRKGAKTCTASGAGRWSSRRRPPSPEGSWPPRHPSTATLITGALLTVGSIAAHVLRHANPKVVGTIPLGISAVLSKDPGPAGELIVALNDPRRNEPEPTGERPGDDLQPDDQAHGQ